MTDVGHEVGAIRFLVEAPLSSRVAMFNQVANKHHNGQLLNPFSEVDGRRSPKPQFSKEDYGKPVAGSLTEQRGQKANMKVLKEMLELCQLINSEGHPTDEPGLKGITFGELFNIYQHINDKVVGLLLRARKHKLITFEGECLFQRRDDDVPIFMLLPIAEIKKTLDDKVDMVRRSVSPNPMPATAITNPYQQS